MLKHFAGSKEMPTFAPAICIGAPRAVVPLSVCAGKPGETEGWSGSSVGLEQQPSKLWVKGSNPFRITRIFLGKAKLA